MFTGRVHYSVSESSIVDLTAEKAVIVSSRKKAQMYVKGFLTLCNLLPFYKHISNLQYQAEHLAF